MKKKILIVDDDKSILEAVSLILEDEGYSTEIVFKGDEIYKRIEMFKPDLILLDVLMSGVDGRDICKQLKSDITTKHIPIIMVSAHPSAKEGAKKNGANDFLPKPFEVNDLLEIISKHI